MAGGMTLLGDEMRYQRFSKKTVDLERLNRELRRWEKLGTVWTEHNLMALLPEQGLLN